MVYDAFASAVLGAGAPPAAGARMRWYRRSLEHIRQAHARHRERRELLQLDDRALTDIGLTRCDALSEAGKPFWQP
jgi:uncharacterized protein YjiS (DUF1127 family)